MLQVKLHVVNRIPAQSSKFATGVEEEAGSVSKLNDSPDACKVQTTLFLNAPLSEILSCIIMVVDLVFVINYLPF